MMGWPTIGWRGPMAFAVGGLFVVVAITPEVFGSDIPPTWLLWFVGLFGALFVYIGLWLMRFTWLRAWVTKHSHPALCTIEVFPPKDDESAIYNARVVLLTGTWQVPVVSRKATREAVGQGPAEGRAWLHPNNKSPLALERDGQWLETIPQAEHE